METWDLTRRDAGGHQNLWPQQEMWGRRRDGGRTPKPQSPTRRDTQGPIRMDMGRTPGPEDPTRRDTRVNQCSTRRDRRDTQGPIRRDAGVDKGRTRGPQSPIRRDTQAPTRRDVERTPGAQDPTKRDARDIQSPATRDTREPPRTDAGAPGEDTGSTGPYREGHDGRPQPNASPAAASSRWWR